MSRYMKYKATYQAYQCNHREEIRKRRERLNYFAEYRKRNPETFAKSQIKWRKHNMEKPRVYKRMAKHREEYPLGNECIFCGRTSNLEHAHLDYDDKRHNYVTTCHQCNVVCGWINHES